MEDIKIVYKKDGKEMELIIEIEDEFIDSSYYVWQKIVTVLHKFHGMDNLVEIKIVE